MHPSSMIHSTNHTQDHQQTRTTRTNASLSRHFFITTWPKHNERDVSFFPGTNLGFTPPSPPAGTHLPNTGFLSEAYLRIARASTHTSIYRGRVLKWPCKSRGESDGPVPEGDRCLLPPLTRIEARRVLSAVCPSSRAAKPFIFQKSTPRHTTPREKR